MRVVAFADVHWMSRHVQEEVYEYDPPLDYAPFVRLCKRILRNLPDVIVDLGDLTELYWESAPKMPDAYTLLQLEGLNNDDVEFHKLNGNHDRDNGEEYTIIDGVRYEHGHKLGPRTETREEYVVEVRVLTVGQRLVHGHTHMPQDGMPLDVGSVTFNGTYGEVIDGKSYLRYI